LKVQGREGKDQDYSQSLEGADNNIISKFSSLEGKRGSDGGQGLG